MFVIALLTNLGRFLYLKSLPARKAINYAMARKSPIIFGSYVVHIFFVVSSVEEWIKSCKMTKAGNLLYCNIQPIVFVHVVNLWLMQFLSWLRMISFYWTKIKYGFYVKTYPGINEIVLSTVSCHIEKHQTLNLNFELCSLPL